ncbi:MAG: hypothetical protein RL385_1858 [Pseudomonadota bacterium]|jgi:hypothetical protein
MLSLRILCSALPPLLFGCAAARLPSPHESSANAAPCTVLVEEGLELKACVTTDPTGELAPATALLAAVRAQAEGPVPLRIGQRLYYVNAAGILRETLVFDNGPDYFEDGLARTVEHGKVGFMDGGLHVRIAPAWDFAFPFQDGFAVVCNGCRTEADGEHSRMVGGVWGYIDKAGRIKVPLAFTDATLPGVPSMSAAD